MAEPTLINKIITSFTKLENKSYLEDDLEENLTLYKNIKEILSGCREAGYLRSEIKNSSHYLRNQIISQLQDKTKSFNQESDIEELNLHMCQMSNFNCYGIGDGTSASEPANLMFMILETELEKPKDERKYKNEQVYTYLSNIIARNMSSEIKQKSLELLNKYAGKEASSFKGNWKHYNNLVSPIN